MMTFVKADGAKLENPVKTPEDLEAWLDSIEKKAISMWKEHRIAGPILLALIDNGESMLFVDIADLYVDDGPGTEGVNAVIEKMKEQFEIDALVQVVEAYVGHDESYVGSLGDDPNAQDCVILSFESRSKQELRIYDIDGSDLKRRDMEGFNNYSGRMVNRLSTNKEGLN